MRPVFLHHALPVFLLLLFSSFSRQAWAQQVPMIGGYAFNPFLLNPAEAGSGENIRLFGHYRNQYADYEGAPVTQIFTADGAIPKKKFGLGLQVFNDQTNILQHTGFSLAYAYRLDLSDALSLRMGVSGNLSRRGIDFSKIQLEDEQERANMQGMQQNTHFDGDAGVSLRYQNLHFGFAIPQLLETTTDYSDGQDLTTFSYRNQRQYLTQLSYRFDFGEQFSLQPMGISRLSANFSPQYEGILMGGYQDRYFLNLGYRSNYAVTAGMGIQISEAIMAGYTYDMPTNALSGFTSGSHEVMVGITLDQLFGSRGTLKGDSSAATGEEALSQQLQEQTMMNIRLREEIEAYRDRINQPTEQRVSLDSLKAQSSAIVRRESELKPASSDDAYVLVLGAFRNIENVIAFQRLRKRLGQEAPTQVVQTLDGKWNLVYRQAFASAAEASKAVQEAQYQQPDVFSGPWIYVEPESLPEPEVDDATAPAKPNNTRQLEPGQYAIQVGMFKKYEVSMNRFKALESFGPLYQKNTEGKMVIRLGPFKTRDQAKAKLQEVKSRGYGDAFITPEQGGKATFLSADE